MPVVSLEFTSHGRQLGMALDLDRSHANENAIIRYLERGRYYEPDVARLMMRVVAAGDVVVDVGANAGFFSVLLAKLTGPAGHVLSFEPGRNTLSRLKHNIALNTLDNIILVERPAGADAGPVTFFINNDDSGGNALWDVGTFPGNVKSAAAPERLTLQATTVDAEVARHNLPTPKLIKIDTEGAELDVLRGCRNLLESRVPYVVAEYHPFGLAKMGATTADLRAFMESRGYATFALYYDGTMPRLIPPGTEIAVPSIINLLFSTPEHVAKAWPAFFHHPGVVHPTE